MIALRVPLGVALAVLIPVSAPTAQPQQTPPRAGTVTEGVRAVLVDVVVRDRRGQPVRDLSQADFEVFEDGVPQKIGSFAPVFESEPSGAAPARSPTAPAASGEAAAAGRTLSPAVDSGPIVTALVFDRLNPEAQRLAVQAAQNYLGSREEAPNYIGIFGVDLALTPYAPFTRNVNVLRQGLNKVGSRSTATFGSAERQQQRASADRQAAQAAQAAATAAAAGGPGASAAMGTFFAAAQLAQMESQMIGDFDAMERD
jgi:VWFA-related protein